MKPDKERKLSKSLVDNREFIKELLGIGVSFDADVRTLRILDTEVDIYFVNGLNDKDHINIVMKELLELNDFEPRTKNVHELIENRLVNNQVEKVDVTYDAITEILSGLIIVIVDGYQEAFAVDTRNYPGRTPTEPDTEKVVRGSRDGYTENIIVNTGLTRRRVRDDNLRFEMLRVGERSRTDVAIAYLKDVVDPGLVGEVRENLKKIDVDGLSMAEKSLEEFVVNQKGNPFPLVRFTERPDVASAHLFEGHVLIMVDTSPSVIITPTTFFHHVQHAEEFRQSPIVGSFVRWVRFFAILFSIFLLPLWLLFVLHPELLPPEMSYIGPNEEGNIPILVQLILADIGVEFLRIAAIHTPTAVSTAMGLVAAILIGEIAIEVGLFSPEIILYVAISAMGAYATPSYELSVANKLARLILVIITAILGVKGLVIGFTLYILYLTKTISLNTPYFWPVIPFNAKALYHILFRVPIPLHKVRPSIVHPQDERRR
ncbi:spore germination protein [Piscibacillus halophilus]|uniref:Stage V sporulation protein AF n=1 Tax=Piscibacillus halophilus TaxID=571933 RepID=A0A1H9A018_9BACI|nr:spore germination protein [Piscibacillus halophilus]SEP70096.1 stage V sporulation protein AF [Piscibacillus halophilus]